MRTKLLGTPVDILDFDKTVAKAEQAIISREQCVHVALNVAKFVKMRDDAELRADVTGGDIIGIDGMGIAWALKFFGVNNVTRVTGVDLMSAMLNLSAEKGYKPFILGAKQEVLDTAISNASARWPGLKMAGSRNGYFGPEDEAGIVKQINDSNADCLFLAMPTPKKERFLAAYAKSLNVPFIMGVGGSVDVLAGHVKRAPVWMQKSGLEWSYRLLQEPRKMFRRYASTNGRFLWIILKARMLGSGLKWQGGEQNG
ncbi:WecB/TagA/CpsF family glycosyltransferase [Sphingorhabdus sp. Alg239-R122]|uniref:WecB/TagA/CpsF family glycosyltransferase n=1 Tax=Sphingorhabdus sp. Alg239-R122 TaxID=2305989 RepID=UPI0013DAF461|nr:WecB/TagA/CpsF family glycosyltransferase [Sphingorhabdus sp. Alg239-R122]